MAPLVTNFFSDCRQVWHDIIDLRGLQAYVVSGSPRGLPSTVLHVILFQGELQGLNLALFRSEGAAASFQATSCAVSCYLNGERSFSLGTVS